MAPLTGFAEDDQPKPQTSSSDQTDRNFLSSSLAKELQRIQEDRDFVKYRDERVELLAQIPELRTSIQELKAELSKLSDHKSRLVVRLNASVSGIKSTELQQLETTKSRISLNINSLKISAKAAKDRVDALKNNLSAAEQYLNKTTEDLKEIHVKINDATQRLETARSNQEKLQLVLDRKYLVQKDKVETAVQELRDLIEREKLIGTNEDIRKAIPLAQDKVRSANEELSKLRHEELSDEYIDARNDYDRVSRQVDSLKKSEDQALNAERDARANAKRIERDLLAQEKAVRDTNTEIEHVNLDLSDIDQKIKAQIEHDKTRTGSAEDLQKQIDDLVEREVAIKKNLDSKEEELKKTIARQSTVENEINTLLIPRTAENSFKLTVSIYFAGLVGLVIALFFIVALKDSEVRKMVFSAEAGIQFVTLFSLVIAIILFGITGILEGKELAALLGGISGYILGRVAPGTGTKQDATGDGTVPA